jgi:hypothetical protein
MHQRRLTDAERTSLSPGLVAALDAAGVAPVIISRAAWLARLTWMWRGHVPILTRGHKIYWPGAPEDFSARPAAMAILQHELQHVLDFSTGRLSALGYLFDPRNWTYRLPSPDRWDWKRLGAEQRAVLAETLWRAEREGGEKLDACRSIIPWVDDCGLASTPDDLHQAVETRRI